MKKFIFNLFKEYIISYTSTANVPKIEHVNGDYKRLEHRFTVSKLYNQGTQEVMNIIEHNKRMLSQQIEDYIIVKQYDSQNGLDINVDMYLFIGKVKD